MHLHVRIHHWVLWWFWVGVVCAVVVGVNLLTRTLTRPQEDAVVIVGAIYWLLGGLVCHAFDGVKIDRSPDYSAWLHH
jgi:formate-dependent nitrite reductase membrane component NrfD